MGYRLTGPGGQGVDKSNSLGTLNTAQRVTQGLRQRSWVADFWGHRLAVVLSCQTQPFLGGVTLLVTLVTSPGCHPGSCLASLGFTTPLPCCPQMSCSASYFTLHAQICSHPASLRSSPTNSTPAPPPPLLRIGAAMGLPVSLDCLAGMSSHQITVPSGKGCIHLTHCFPQQSYPNRTHRRRLIGVWRKS